MKRGLLAQFLALAVLSTALVQGVSIDAAEAAFAATPVGLKTVGVKNAGLAWADFNEDGCLDVLVTTNNPAGPDQWTQLYRSDCSLPNPTFTNVTATHAPGLANARSHGQSLSRQVAWGDLNNDGHVDFIAQDTSRLSLWFNKGPLGVPAYGFGGNLANNQAALSAGVGQLPQTGINADRVGLYGLLLLLAGALLLLWGVLADRRRRDAEAPLGP